jgi:transposase
LRQEIHHSRLDAAHIGGMLARKYPSDLCDAEWDIVQPLIPPARSNRERGGHPVVHDKREILDAIFYVLRTGCSWRQLPVDFAPWQTVYGYFAQWTQDGTIRRVHDALRDQVRAKEGRDEQPSAAIIDAQVVKGADTVGAASRGYDAGKKTNGRKRHAIVDTMGLLLMVVITAASVQDRDGARTVTEKMRADFPGVELIWADGGYAGRFVSWAKELFGLAVEIVRKLEGQRGFVVLPRRWVVERTFAWITKCRRLALDYERRIDHAESMVQLAMIGLMLRRLARGVPGSAVTAYGW